MNAQTLVAKVWNFAHVLRDQGVSYQAYISQISYLLFLKMDEERVTQIGGASMLPDGARWGDIKDLSGERLNATYVKLLDRLSKQGGIIGAIFLKAQNEIQDPAKQHLRRPTCPQRRGREIGRRTILHAALPDRDDGAGGRSQTASDNP